MLYILNVYTFNTPNGSGEVITQVLPDQWHEDTDRQTDENWQIEIDM